MRIMTALEMLVCEIVGSGLSVSVIPVDRCKTNYRLTVIYPGGQKASIVGPVSALEEWWRGDDKDRAIKALEEEVAELSVTIGVRDKRIGELEREVEDFRDRDWRGRLLALANRVADITAPIAQDSVTTTIDASPLYDYVID